jgi:hypothetical protein
MSARQFLNQVRSHLTTSITSPVLDWVVVDSAARSDSGRFGLQVTYQYVI